MGGSELLVEGGSQINADSIFINSSCDSIVRIGAINTNSPNPPKILKTGFNILDLDYVEINHLDAQVVSGETYNLTNSLFDNSTLNWSTTPLAAELIFIGGKMAEIGEMLIIGNLQLVFRQLVYQQLMILFILIIIHLVLQMK